MKVLELCSSPSYGGLEMYVHKVMTWLSDRQEPGLAVVAPGSTLESKLKEAGLPHRPLRVRNRLFPIIAAKNLAKILDDEAIDVLHMHWGKDLNLAALAKRLCRRPVRLVYTRQMALTRSKRDPYHRWLYQKVDQFVVITDTLRKEANQYLPLPPEQIALLYYGVPVAKPIEAAQCAEFLHRHGLDGPGLKVALFGRIEHVKGQHLLLRAVETLAARGCEVRAGLIGEIFDQSYFDKLEEQIEQAGLHEHVKYLGFVDDPTSIMGCFDVVVLTTYTETFGLVLAEAMRAGTAVIATNGGGVPEIIQHTETGLLFEVGDAAGLADSIESLARDPEMRTRLASKGKAFADEHFSEPRHFEGLQEIFDAVLSR